MTVIIDYGVGNLFSLTCSFKKIGAEVTVSSDPNIIMRADRLVLPGVGAFEDAAAKLKNLGLDVVILKKAAEGTPVLGICLGMQLLFERSFEYGEHRGLGLLAGDIVPFKGAVDSSLKIPHIGWNSVKKLNDCPIFKYVKDGEFVYFVHSFYAPKCVKSSALTSEYGIEFTAAVWQNNIFGCQFHPEKSGETGLNILRAFIKLGEN